MGAQETFVQNVNAANWVDAADQLNGSPMYDILPFLAALGTNSTVSVNNLSGILRNRGWIGAAQRIYWAGEVVRTRTIPNPPPGLPADQVTDAQKFLERLKAKTGPLPRSEWSGDSSMWPQDKKIRSMHPNLRPKVTAVLAGLRGRGFRPKVFYGWRSVAVQRELKARGASQVDFSFHNAQLRDGTPNAYAADIVDERWNWTAAAETNGFWTALGEEAAAEGLVWGGNWTGFRDVAHVQLVQNSELARVKRESGL